VLLLQPLELRREASQLPLRLSRSNCEPQRHGEQGKADADGERDNGPSEITAERNRETKENLAQKIDEGSPE
jgi:hypothetical protein